MPPSHPLARGTLWAIPASLQITDADTSDCLFVLDDALTRELLERDTRLPYLRSAELKYKYSDLRLAKIENIS